MSTGLYPFFYPSEDFGRVQSTGLFPLPNSFNPELNSTENVRKAAKKSAARLDNGNDHSESLKTVLRLSEY